jgi:hypothetical protein
MDLGRENELDHGQETGTLHRRANSTLYTNSRSRAPVEAFMRLAEWLVESD